MDKFSENCFLDCCGGVGRIKLLLRNLLTQTESVFVFEKPSILLGQHPNADIRLLDSGIGRRHLYLQLLGGSLFAVSLVGNCPLRLGEQERKAGWINAADTIEFGSYALRILEGVSEAPPTDGSLANPLVSSVNGIGPLCLEFRGDPVRTFRGHVNRPLSLVGSSELCKFRIHSDRISSVHCSLVRTARGIWAADLAGRDGLRLNGVSSSTACLEEGDRFELGGIGFDVHYQSSAPALMAPLQSASMPSVTQRVVIAEPAIAPNSERESFQRLISPVLDHFAEFQNQTFQQFQELLGNMLQMFGSMFRDQQQFIREEMRRFDQITDELASLRQTLGSLPETAAAPPEAEVVPEPPEAELPPAAPSPRTNPGAPVTEPDMHVWLQTRIAQLHEQRNSLWNRLVGMIRGGPKAT
jgi:hypothetical protein